MVKRILILIMALAINVGASATDYYVKTGGNDANTGLSDGQAWAHHPWMSTWTGSVTLQPGDIVKLNKGDTWSISSPIAPYMTIAQSGTDGNSITTTNYGTGNLPIINIATNTAQPVISGLGKSYIKFDGVAVSHWSKLWIADDAYGYTGIRFGNDGGGNISHDWEIVNSKFYNCPHGGVLGWRDCYNIVIGDSSATSVATDIAFSNEFYDIGRNAVFLQGNDPVGGVANWYVDYNYIHEIRTEATESGTNGLSYGIAFCSISTSSGNPSYGYMRYNLVENIPAWTAFDCHGGDHIYIQNNRAYNCNMMAGLQSFGIGGSVTPSLHYIYLEDNDFENPEVIPFDELYFVQCNGNANLATNCFIRDNTMYFTAPPAAPLTCFAIKLSLIDNVEVSGNKIYNGAAGTNYGAIFLGSSTTISNITINANFIQGFGHGIMMYNDGINNFTISNNILSTQGYGIYSASRGTNTPAGDLTIINNSILTKTYASFDVAVWMFAMIISEGRAVTIKNNIIGFLNDPVTGEYIYAPATITGTFNCDYNLYYNTTDATPFAHTGGSRTWAWWQSTAGLDMNSPNVTQSLDPLFINAGGSLELDTDFDLAESSLAINAGIDVGLRTDYFGTITPQGVNFDIGAYEFASFPITTTGLGWEPHLAKRNFKDDVNFEKGFSVAGVPVVFSGGSIVSIPGLTATATELNILDGATLSTEELNYVTDVTSGIQDQIDDKAPSDSPTFTTAVTLPASIILPSGTVLSYDGGDVIITHSANTLTIGGGDLDLEANDLLTTGDVGADLSRVNKLWVDDIDVTNSVEVIALEDSTGVLEGSYATGYDNEYQNDNLIKALGVLGCTFKALPLHHIPPYNSITLIDSVVYWFAVWLAEDVTITGVRFITNSPQANFTISPTADNMVGLYSYSGGTLTKVANSTDNDDLWKAGTYSQINAAFSSTYAAKAGLYYVAFCYNAKAETTAPKLYYGEVAAGAHSTFYGTARLIGNTIPATATLPATQTATDILGTYVYGWSAALY